LYAGEAFYNWKDNRSDDFLQPLGQGRLDRRFRRKPECGKAARGASLQRSGQPENFDKENSRTHSGADVQGLRASARSGRSPLSLLADVVKTSPEGRRSGRQGGGTRNTRGENLPASSSRSWTFMGLRGKRMRAMVARWAKLMALHAIGSTRIPLAGKSNARQQRAESAYEAIAKGSWSRSSESPQTRDPDRKHGKNDGGSRDLSARRIVPQDGP